MADRRLFLRYLGAGLTGAAAGCLGLGPIARAHGPMPFGQTGTLNETGLSFTPIVPSIADQLLLPWATRRSETQ